MEGRFRCLGDCTLSRCRFDFLAGQPSQSFRRGVDAARRLDGRPRIVQLYQRDFKPEQGVLIPHVLETTVQGVNKSEKIVIDSVKVNPPIDDARFTKPK